MFQVANASLMVIISVMTLKTGFSVKRSVQLSQTDLLDINLSKVVRHQTPSFSPLLKFIFIWCFDAPNFLVATSRLIKLIVQYLNPGQTVCLVNDEGPPLGEPSLGTEFEYVQAICYFRFTVRKFFFFELKIALNRFDDSGEYYIQALGGLSTCDFASSAFAYMYLVLLAMNVIGLVLMAVFLRMGKLLEK